MHRVIEKKKKRTAGLMLKLQNISDSHNCEVNTSRKLVVGIEKEESSKVKGKGEVKERKMKQGRPPITVRHILSQPMRLFVDISLSRPADNVSDSLLSLALACLQCLFL